MAPDPSKDCHKGKMDLEPKRGDDAALLAAKLHSGASREKGMFTGMGFRFPRFHHSDHCAIIAVVRAGGGRGG